MLRSITLLAAILTCASGIAAAADSLPHAHDFKRDGARAAADGTPILVLFSRPGCAFCERVRNEYLLPLQKDPAYMHKVMLREIDITSGAKLALFDGKATTESAFAAANKIYLVPTIVVFDANGTPVADPIVGLLSPDFYFGYIDAAITAGVDAMHARKPLH
jgi:hypothetical protein